MYYIIIFIKNLIISNSIDWVNRWLNKSLLIYIIAYIVLYHFNILENMSVLEYYKFNLIQSDQTFQSFFRVLKNSVENWLTRFTPENLSFLNHSRDLSRSSRTGAPS